GWRRLGQVDRQILDENLCPERFKHLPARYFKSFFGEADRGICLTLALPQCFVRLILARRERRVRLPSTLCQRGFRLVLARLEAGDILPPAFLDSKSRRFVA